MEMSLKCAVRRLVEGYSPGRLPWVYVGVDPGATGAVAFVRTGTRPEAFVVDIPTVKLSRKGGTRTECNYAEVGESLRELMPYASAIHFCVEEAQIQVKGRGANAYTAFRVGVGYGLWPGAVAAAGFGLQVVHPSVWKKEMGLRGKDKEDSRALALKLFPRCGLHRKKDHNRAEALLIAEWFRRKAPRV